MRLSSIFLFITILLLSLLLLLLPSEIYYEHNHNHDNHQEHIQIFILATIFAIPMLMFVFTNKESKDVYKWSPIFVTFVTYIWVLSLFYFVLDYDFYRDLFTLAFIHTAIQHYHTRKTIKTFISKQQRD